VTRAYTLRPATAGDASAIHTLIRSVRINPTGLDWRRFLIAVDEHGALISCGQVKPHGDGSRELASIAVYPSWRGQGVASAIISQLIEMHPGPLYLTCRPPLRPFYERFGFRPISPCVAPPYFHRIYKILEVLQRLHILDHAPLIMLRLDHPLSESH
jgi:GNAT superfamily N-acetyltransferase